MQHKYNVMVIFVLSTCTCMYRRVLCLVVLIIHLDKDTLLSDYTDAVGINNFNYLSSPLL